jgi:hypothetical protein
MGVKIGLLLVTLLCLVTFVSGASAATLTDTLHFKDKVDKETTSHLQTTFIGVNVVGLPLAGNKPAPSLAGQTVTFTIGSASFQGTADSKGKVAEPFNAALKGATLSLKFKGLQLISLFPLATSDGKDKTVSVHFNVTATMAGQAPVVLVDKNVVLIYSAKNGNISGKGPAPELDTTSPTVIRTSPADMAVGTPLNRSVTATFSEQMDSSTLNPITMTLLQGTTPVAGTISYSGTTAAFNPSSNLTAGTAYTATLTTGAKDLAGNAMQTNFTWSFTTGLVAAKGPAPVPLGVAGNFVILAKSGIDTVPNSAITGDIGVSPAAASFITGFGLTADASNVFSTSPQVTGKVFASDYAVPTPTNLTTAESNMETAYTDAAGRPTPNFTDLGAGDISGLTLVPGLYKWGTGVLINTDVTLNGGPNDVWIFQVAQGITQANGTHIILSGGALPKNIFWQSAGVVAVGTTAHFEGVILSQTTITLDTGASINGRLLAQTAVTLKSSTVTQPAP